MEEKSKRGGFREGAGRKKTTTARFGFNAPADVADILSRTEHKTDYICEAIREYYKLHGCK